ncbi:MAG: LLM class F420-dependent oxidoreductase [Chloroflexi bacterium]|nr:LLM class F420-dependent oxidoreductase [Chloroflexota bacterium]
MASQAAPGQRLQVGVALPNLGFGMDPSRPDLHRELVLAVAEQAEALGFDSVWVGDHLALPKHPQRPYPYSQDPNFIPSDSPLLDPISTIAFVAGRTRRVKLGFGVLVAPYRHPLVAAKLLSTIDVLSEGRLILGVGVGWMPEEFAATQADFDRRGAATDEWIRFVREAWSADYPEFEGEFYRISGMSVLPKPVQSRVPIWIGGNTNAALRRAVALGDGWDALHALPDALAPRLDELWRLCDRAGRRREEMTVCVRGGPLSLKERPDTDPDRQPLSGTPEQVTETLRAYRDLGVGHVVIGTDRRDRRGALGSMERFAREIMPTIR